MGRFTMSSSSSPPPSPFLPSREQQPSSLAGFRMSALSLSTSPTPRPARRSNLKSDAHRRRRSSSTPRPRVSFQDDDSVKPFANVADNNTIAMTVPSLKTMDNENDGSAANLLSRKLSNEIALACQLVAAGGQDGSVPVASSKSDTFDVHTRKSTPFRLHRSSWEPQSPSNDNTANTMPPPPTFFKKTRDTDLTPFSPSVKRSPMPSNQSLTMRGRISYDGERFARVPTSGARQSLLRVAKKKVQPTFSFGDLARPTLQRQQAITSGARQSIPSFTDGTPPASLFPQSGLSFVPAVIGQRSAGTDVVTATGFTFGSSLPDERTETASGFSFVGNHMDETPQSRFRDEAKFPSLSFADFESSLFELAISSPLPADDDDGNHYEEVKAGELEEDPVEPKSTKDVGTITDASLSLPSSSSEDGTPVRSKATRKVKSTPRVTLRSKPATRRAPKSPRMSGAMTRSMTKKTQGVMTRSATKRDNP